MYDSCKQKQSIVKKLFDNCTDSESRYSVIIDLGRSSAAISDKYKISDNLVKGCQSRMYLHSHLEGNSVIFESEADSLISAGLAVLLVRAYSGESPEAILKCPPDFLDDLEINASLTMGRANGLASLHLRMRQDALKFLMAQAS